MAKVNSKKIIITVVAVIAAVVLIGGVAFAADYISVTGGQDDDRIASGVSIGAVDVSGMTAEEAYTAISEYVSETGRKSITLIEEESGGSVDFSVNDLGLACTNEEEAVEAALKIGKEGSFLGKYRELRSLKKETQTIDMQIEVSQEKIEELVSENSEQFESPAVEATLEKVDGQFVVTPEQTGVVVDIEASVEKINEYMSGNWDETDEDGEIALVVEDDIPSVTAEDLESIKDELGSFNTSFASSNENRATNLDVAAAKINGTVLLPGEEFSMADASGPFDEENGYKKAGAYQDGEVIESWGGGICQVSTTLFNAALAAELEITERFEHSMTVSYVPWGMDAAIAGTYKDLKFVNNQDKPIYIESYTSNRVIYFTIYGEETRDTANRTVTYENKVTSRNEGAETYTASDAEFGRITKVSSGQAGGSAELYKVVTENGVETSRELVYTSSYRATESKYEVGTAGGDEESVKALKSAISSNDRSKIDAAIAAGKQSAKETQEEESRKAEEEKQKEAEEKKKQEEEKAAAEQKKQEEEKQKEADKKKQEEADESNDENTE